MFKRLFVSCLLIFCFISVFPKNTVTEDSVAFSFKDNVVTESDLKAFAYIFKKNYRTDRAEILEKAVKIEKMYYCLKENYPFEGEFGREYPFLFYQLNYFYNNRLLAEENFKSYGIDFEIVNHNLFKFLFVLKYSFLLADQSENDCLKIPVYFNK